MLIMTRGKFERYLATFHRLTHTHQTAQRTRMRLNQVHGEAANEQSVYLRTSKHQQSTISTLSMFAFGVLQVPIRIGFV